MPPALEIVPEGHGAKSPDPVTFRKPLDAYDGLIRHWLDRVHESAFHAVKENRSEE
jgi:hypothetical protein